jgi:hypothetical protein
LETGKVRDSREKGMVEDAGIMHEGPYYLLQFQLLGWRSRL